MTCVLHRLAEQDIDSVFQFYRNHGSDKLALRFLAEFERVAALIEREPEIGTPTNDGRRSCPLRRYPYSIIYKAIPSGVCILVVRHHRRAPAYGGKRS